MENNLRKLIIKNNIKGKKITFKNNTRIIDTNDRRIVIKKRSNNNLDSIYSYLESRGFNYFARIIDQNNDYLLYEYIEEIEEPEEQKASDIINLLMLLHSKTSYYKEVDYDYYKKIYEDINTDIDYLYIYYNDLIGIINKEVYMSPANYLMARNISLVFKMLKYCHNNIEVWYDKVKNKKKVRVVNLHNNVKIEHFIKSKKPYLISWDNSKKDNPIYDLLSFYKNHYLDFDFSELFKQYESGYPLLEDERLLLFILIALPDKLVLDDNEYNLCIKISKYFDNLSKCYDLLSKYKK